MVLAGPPGGRGATGGAGGAMWVKSASTTCNWPSGEILLDLHTTSSSFKQENIHKINKKGKTKKNCLSTFYVC